MWGRKVPKVLFEICKNRPKTPLKNTNFTKKTPISIHSRALGESNFNPLARARWSYHFHTVWEARISSVQTWGYLAVKITKYVWQTIDNLLNLPKISRKFPFFIKKVPKVLFEIFENTPKTPFFSLNFTQKHPQFKTIIYTLENIFWPEKIIEIFRTSEKIGQKIWQNTRNILDFAEKKRKKKRIKSTKVLFKIC